MKKILAQVLSNFGINDAVESVLPIKTGHINQTFVVTVAGKSYTVQTINTYVFPDVEGVMENILSVTEHLRKKVVARDGDPKREVLHFYPGNNGKGYWKDEEGKYWRVYDFVDDAVSYSIADARIKFMP